MTIIYADPPYLGQCASYDHFHNDGGSMPWDGLCWDEVSTHADLPEWLLESDGWAYSCNPSDLTWASGYGRVCAWTKTWHQIRPTSTQFAWEPVIFKTSKKDPKRPMVRDWLSCAVTKQTGQRGAKPDAFNDWILDLLCYEPGDDFTDLFPGSGGMSRAVERRARRLVGTTEKLQNESMLDSTKESG